MEQVKWAWGSRQFPSIHPFPFPANSFRYVTALHAKVPLTLHDPSPLVLSTAMKKLSSLLARDVEKKRISKEVGDEAMSRIKSVEGDLITGSAGLESDTDLVIEVCLLLRWSSRANGIGYS